MSTTGVRVRATHVFLSYSRANKSFAQRLVADLQRSGITVWIDQSGLTPGTPDWETALRDAIGKAHAVILLASEEARKSPYVKDELRLAHDIYHLPVYPLWVAGTQWINCIPLGWGSTEYIDARGDEAQYQAALHQLRAVLSGANAVTSLYPISSLGHPSPYSGQFPPNTTQVGPSTSGIPSRQAPAIYPRGPSYPPTQPTPLYSQRRKTGNPCLVATLISVALLLIMVVGAIFIVPKILSLVISSPTATATTGPGGGSPTSVPANITVSPLTLTATNGASTADCDYWSSFYGSDSGWTCKIRLQNNGQNMVNWRATAPSEVDVRPGSTGFLEAGGNWTLTVHVPLKDCPDTIDVTITPDGGTPQTVVWTCS